MIVIVHGVFRRLRPTRTCLMIKMLTCMGHAQRVGLLYSVCPNRGGNDLMYGTLEAETEGSVVFGNPKTVSYSI